MPETMYALDNPYLSEYILRNLEEWTEYSIRVRAYNERGEGPISYAAIERTSDTGTFTDCGFYDHQQNKNLVSYGHDQN